MKDELSLPDDLILPATEIADPAQLKAEIDKARAAHADDKAFRKAAIGLLNATQEQGRTRIAEAFAENPRSSSPTTRAYCWLTDCLVEAALPLDQVQASLDTLLPELLKLLADRQHG